MKKITSVDVARRAGVSRATVSYVLNNVQTEKISEKTKQQVLKAVEELGYVPNATGQALASKRTRNLGLVCLESHLTHPFLLQIINGLTGLVRQHDLRLIIDTIKDGAGGGAILSLTQTKSIDGLVLFETRKQDDELKMIREQNFPVVIIGEYPELDVCSVDVEVRHAAQIAVNHLIELGHRKIACITNAPLIYTAGSGRLDGYRTALEDAGIPYSDQLVRYGEFTPESGFVAMRDLLDHVGNEITAVFVASDTVAFGAMRALHLAGCKIPDDIAVMGYDNIPLAPFHTPPLSSMGISGSQLGAEAGKLLLELIDGKVQPGVRRLFDATLIARESTTGRRDEE